MPLLEIICPCLQDPADDDGDSAAPLTLRLGMERSHGRVRVFSVNRGLDRARASEALSSRVEQGYPAAISATLRQCASWLLERRAQESRFELRRHVPIVNVGDVLEAQEKGASFFAFSKHYPDFVLVVTVGEELEPRFQLVHTVAAGPVVTKAAKPSASSRQTTPSHVALSPMSAAFATLSPGSGFTPGLDATPQSGAEQQGSLHPDAAGFASSSRTLARELQGLAWTPAAASAALNVSSSALASARRIDFFCPLVVSRAPLSWLDAMDAQRYVSGRHGVAAVGAFVCVCGSHAGVSSSSSSSFFLLLLPPQASAVLAPASRRL